MNTQYPPAGFFLTIADLPAFLEAFADLVAADFVRLHDFLRHTFPNALRVDPKDFLAVVLRFTVFLRARPIDFFLVAILKID